MRGVRKTTYQIFGFAQCDPTKGHSGIELVPYKLGFWYKSIVDALAGTWFACFLLYYIIFSLVTFLLLFYNSHYVNWQRLRSSMHDRSKMLLIFWRWLELWMRRKILQILVSLLILYYRINAFIILMPIMYDWLLGVVNWWVCPLF